jgi:uncharacterized OB-fold protein
MSASASAIETRLQALVGSEYGRVFGWDPVKQPMIRHWCDAMGNRNPLYVDPDFAARAGHGGPVAPPSMLQVWTMENLHGERAPGSAVDSPYIAVQLLNDNGYPAIVAVNSEQEYLRYPGHGELISYTSMLEAVSERKTTALGEGYFVTVLITFGASPAAARESVETIGTMRFRLFVYRAHQRAEPAPAADAAVVAKPLRPRPAISADTQFFWDGLQQRQLLIQRCGDCGRLRHPPGPSCPQCHSLRWDTVEASGRGRIHSFVVMHYPEVPPFEYPLPIVLVELAEGTRLVAGIRGVKPADIRIEAAVQVEFEQVDAELVLPVFRLL